MRYADGEWGKINWEKDAFLVDPGTQAIVVQTRSQNVGLKVTEGQFRNRYGWTFAADVQPIPQP